MKISLIISVYKNAEALKVVLDSLRYQTHSDFEIIISEDGSDQQMESFVESYVALQPIFHLTQEDIGWRKNKALNEAVRKSRGNYLIFIDGDCVLHHRFIEEHIKLAKPNRIVAGKRVKLGKSFTQEYLKGRRDFLYMEKIIATQFTKLRDDGACFIEEGVYLGNTWLADLIPSLRPMQHLKGCNMSFYKHAIEEINGFDEDYTLPAVGEDADLAWRFEAMGFSLISARNRAVQYHLYHPSNWHDQSQNLKLMQEKMEREEFVCTNGLRKVAQLKDLIME